VDFTLTGSWTSGQKTHSDIECADRSAGALLRHGSTRQAGMTTGHINLLQYLQHPPNCEKGLGSLLNTDWRRPLNVFKKGFTLLRTDDRWLAIIGILAAIALAGLSRDYVVRSRVSEAMVMAGLASRRRFAEKRGEWQGTRQWLHGSLGYRTMYRPVG